MHLLPPPALRRSGLTRATLAALVLAVACDQPDGRETAPDLTTQALTTSTGTTGPTAGVTVCERDAWEPNDVAEAAGDVGWNSADEYSAWRRLDDLYLCARDEDWFFFDIEPLDYALHYVYIRGLVAGAGLCGAECGEPVIAPGPQHALTIEVYRADTRDLLTSASADDGVLALGGHGEPYRHGLLLRVYSPTVTAAFPYRLTVNLRNYEGEDECEC